MDEKKIADLIDALADLLDAKAWPKFGFEDVDAIDVGDPFAKGVEAFAMVHTLFKMADRYHFDAETLGFVIAKVQHDFASITGTVPISKEVREFVKSQSKEKEE